MFKYESVRKSLSISFYYAFNIYIYLQTNIEIFFVLTEYDPLIQ